MPLGIIIGVGAGLVVAGAVGSTALIKGFKTLRKSKEALLAKELKLEKTLEVHDANIRQLNKHLQLVDTPIAKKLDNFKVNKEAVENFAINVKSKKKELNTKDKKRATNVKF